MTKIMYVCECCEEENPENCGRYNVKELAVLPSGFQVCEDCYNEFDDGDGQEWSDFPRPVDLLSGIDMPTPTPDQKEYLDKMVDANKNVDLEHVIGGPNKSSDSETKETKK